MEAATEPHRAVDFDGVVAVVHELGRAVVGPAADDVDVRARFPSEALDALKGERLLSAYVPGEYGGMGLPLTVGTAINGIVPITDTRTLLLNFALKATFTCL